MQVLLQYDRYDGTYRHLPINEEWVSLTTTLHRDGNTRIEVAWFTEDREIRSQND